MVRSIPGRGLEVDLREYRKLRDDKGVTELWDAEHQALLLHADTGLDRFFPRVSEDRSQGTSYFLLTRGRKEVASASRPIGKHNIPKRELADLKAKLEAFVGRADSPDAAPDAKLFIQSFRLPDPERSPEMYRLYGWPWNRRLLVLWGCEKKDQSAMPPLDAVGRLWSHSDPFEWLKKLLLWVLLLLLLAVLGWAGYHWFPSGWRCFGGKRTCTVELKLDEKQIGAGTTAPDWSIDWGDSSSSPQPAGASAQVKHEYAGADPYVISVAHSTTQPGVLPPGPERLAQNRQYLQVSPNYALPGDKITAKVAYAGKVDFHGLFQAEVDKDGTASFDGFREPGDYRVHWTPRTQAAAGQSLNEETAIVHVRRPGSTTQPGPVPIYLLPLVVPSNQPIQVPIVSYPGDPGGFIAKEHVVVDGGTEIPVSRDGPVVIGPLPPGEHVFRDIVTDDKGRTSETNTTFKSVPPTKQKPKPVEAPVAVLKLDSKNDLTRSVAVSDASRPGTSGRPIMSWQVEWGDGQTIQLRDPPRQERHSYDTNGHFIIRLTIKDAGDISAVDGLPVDIGMTTPPLPPKPKGAPPTANLQIDSQDDAARTVAVSDASVKGQNDLAEWVIDWGDGSAAETSKVPPKAVAHTYKADGQYTISLVVTDTVGMSASDRRPVKIPRTSPPRKFRIKKDAEGKLVDEEISAALVVVDQADENRNVTVVRWIVDGKDVPENTNQRYVLKRPKGKYRVAVVVEYGDKADSRRQDIPEGGVELGVTEKIETKKNATVEVTP